MAAFIYTMLSLTFYGGDSYDYFSGMKVLNRVASENPSHYFDLMFHGNKAEFYSYFNNETGYLSGHMWRDPKSFFVIRFLSPFAFFGLGSYLISTMIISWLSFFFLWKMYITFARLYPTLDFKMAIAILFMPSVLFWGSAVLKDTIIMVAVAIFTVSFLKIAVNGKISFNLIIGILASSILMIYIKPYVLIAMIPGAAIWFAHGRILAINSQFLRYTIYPFMMVGSMAVGIVVLSSLGSSFGDYGSMDKMVSKAKTTQEDLKRGAQYGQNYYDLGTIENTPAGLAKLMPQAIIAGLYRPFIWEARNPFIALSGLENLYTLFLTLSILYRTRIYKMFSFIGRDPILIFTLLYTIMFAFGIGLATANFGALVRYRIPGLPFLMLSLFVLDYYLKEGKRKEQEAEAEKMKEKKLIMS